MNRNTDIDTRFQKIFDDNYRRLMFHALRFVDTEAEAEDVVADVFYELWRKIDEIDLDGGIVAYLYRAVSTRALNVLRHKNIAAIRIELLKTINERRMDFISDEDIQRNVESGEIRQKMYAAISELPDRCREVFILSYINRLKNKEIADAMNVSVRTVEAQVYKALHFLRGKLRHLMAIVVIFLGLLNK